jgi:pimeloyl-ACP methyl ester carboxylesterase
MSQSDRENLRARYYLGETFVVEHAPVGGADAGVLLLPPLGYEDTSAYRPLRILADALAAAGHLVLRLDWPGQGDSALDDAHPALIARQQAAVRQAVASLRQRGLTRIVAIGVRAGGLLALSAEDIDELVLWGVPASGRAYLRELKAFHRMAARSFGKVPADAEPLPEGSVEAGGFLIRAQTAADLCALPPGGPLRRALVIAREGTAPPTELVAVLRDRGAEVAQDEAGGLGDLLENPYHSALSDTALEAIRAWLASARRVPFAPHAGADRLVLPGGVTERPWIGAGGAGELSGIRCEPPGGASPGAVWTIFFNAGGVRRCGPNRLWTRAARELAAAGRPSLRIDVRDVGDSDGAITPHRDLEAMYSVASIEDGVAALDALTEEGAGGIDVVGLCSGAFMGVQVAARRPVRCATLLNGLAFVWDDDARASSMTSHIRGSLLDARRWKRLLTGRIDAVALARSVLSRARLSAGEMLSRARGQAPASEVDRMLRFVAARGTRLRLISSEGDPSIQYLYRHVEADRLPELVIVPGVDHTIRPVWAHARIVEWIKNPPASDQRGPS